MVLGRRTVQAEVQIYAFTVRSQVQFLVRELRSCKPCSASKKRKEKDDSKDD